MPRYDVSGGFVVQVEAGSVFEANVKARRMLIDAGVPCYVVGVFLVNEDDAECQVATGGSGQLTLC